ncbi:MAG: hypothetical protein ACLUOI_17395 [Eisenbergiella sp.]
MWTASARSHMTMQTPQRNMRRRFRIRRVGAQVQVMELGSIIRSVPSIHGSAGCTLEEVFTIHPGKNSLADITGVTSGNAG